VWDGDQILFEMRVPGDTTGTEQEDETFTGVQYGAVGYVEGPGVDRPLEIFQGTTAVVPFANWRGQYDFGQIPAPGGGSTITFPASQAASYGGYPLGSPGAWWGSLAAGSQDGSGYQYRRNRYYDPTTGRFTQEDPLGLAGGLNAYGFANGDPVNFSDPFGLTCLVKGNCTQSDGPAPEAPQEPGLEHDELGTDLAAAGFAYVVMTGRGLVSMVKGLFSSGAPSTEQAAQIGVGTKVYRVYGGKATQLGRSWTTVDPNATPDYAAHAGLPAENSRTSVVTGVITDMTDVSVTKAVPGASGPGGITEVVIPNAAKQVKVTSVDPFHE